MGGSGENVAHSTFPRPPDATARFRRFIPDARGGRAGGKLPPVMWAALTARSEASAAKPASRSQRREASASEAGAATLEGDRIMQKWHTRALRVPKRWYPEIRGWAKLREKAPSGISGGIPPIPEGVGCQQMTPMGGS